MIPLLRIAEFMGLCVCGSTSAPVDLLPALDNLSDPLAADLIEVVDVVT
jgi:hypothetical protein